MENFKSKTGLVITYYPFNYGSFLVKITDKFGRFFNGFFIGSELSVLQVKNDLLLARYLEQPLKNTDFELMLPISAEVFYFEISEKFGKDFQEKVKSKIRLIDSIIDEKIESIIFHTTKELSSQEIYPYFDHKENGYFIQKQNKHFRIEYDFRIKQHALFVKLISVKKPQRGDQNFILSWENFLTNLYKRYKISAPAAYSTIAKHVLANSKEFIVTPKY